MDAVRTTAGKSSMVSAVSKKKINQPELAITYVFKGINRKGKPVSGEMQAQDLGQAKALLRQQGITPKSIKKKPKPLLGGARSIKAAEMATMTRQLSTMLISGIPLLQALEIIGKGSKNEKLQELMANLAADVGAGNSVAEAMAKHPKYFDDLYRDLIDAGEQSGTLDHMFDRVATYREKSEALKSKIKKALMYPAVVVAAGIIVTGILLLFVVPQFESIFAGFGAELPAFTQLVVNMSRWLQANALFVIAGMVVSGWLFGRAYKSSKKMRDNIDHMLLRLPIFGPLFHKSAMARFARTLQTTFASGIPMIDALRSAAGSSGNAKYRDAIMNIREEVTTGMQMNIAMRMHDIFPGMVVQMVMIGEESGSIDGMLGKVADIYEREVDDMVDGLSSMIEPLIIVMLGGLVGGLMIAMYLPIFQMGQVIG